MASLRHDHEVEVRTTAEALWRALTDPAMTRQYWYGTLIRSTWAPGARWTSESPEGELYLEGTVLECDPPRRLVQTFHIVDEEAPAAEPPSRVAWQIAQHDGACTLTLVHDEMGEATAEYVTGGWEHILAGLQALLETGHPVAEPPEAAGS